MKRIWETYFYWNKTERRGVLPLLILLVILIGVNVFIRYLNYYAPPQVDNDFLAHAKEFENVKSENDSLEAESFQYRKKSPKNNFSYTDNYNKPSLKYNKTITPFNPNNITSEEWMELGLSDKQTQAIERFKNKGGKFYKKEDLKKMYVINDKFYDKIEPYLIFSSNNLLPENENLYNKKTIEKAKVDINQADSSELVSLQGITPKMASKILLVRKTFGGFHSLEQVKDLYGFYEPNYIKLSAVAVVGSVPIKPLKINYCSFKELLQVPGMDYEKVKAIINHRDRVGSFKKTEDLVTLNLVEPNLYAKIAPYLAI